MKPRQWEVWQVDWYHPDTLESKLRPAIVVSPDDMNDAGKFVAIKLSGEAHPAPRWRCIGPLDPAFAKMRLNKITYIYPSEQQELTLAAFKHRRGVCDAYWAALIASDLKALGQA